MGSQTSSFKLHVMWAEAAIDFGMVQGATGNSPRCGVGGEVKSEGWMDIWDPRCIFRDKP